MDIINAIQYIQNLIGLLFHNKTYMVIVGFLSILVTSLLELILEKIDLIGHNDTLNTISSYFITEKNLRALIIFLFLVTITNTFIVIDFITGVINAKKGGKIVSKKVQHTVAKLFGILLYMFVVGIIIVIFDTNYIILLLTLGPIFLSMLREFISIGENLEKYHNSKPTIFTIVDKVFVMIEKTFYKKVKDGIDKIDKIK